jgi:hypothetical protein
MVWRFFAYRDSLACGDRTAGIAGALYLPDGKLAIDATTPSSLGELPLNKTIL